MTIRVEKQFRKNGKLATKYYRNENGEVHRTDGPAVIHYHRNGAIKTEMWMINNTPHRVDGPATTHKDKYANLEQESYFTNSQLNRTDGPATIQYHYTYTNHKHKNLVMTTKQYYLNGKKYSQKEWQDKMFYDDFEKTMLESD